MTEITAGSVQKPNVLVVQYGARRQYAVPAALAHAGMLEGLYTDICGTVGLGRALASLAPLGSQRIAKLARRRPPPEVTARTRSFPIWRLAIERAARASDPAKRVRALRKAHAAAGRAMIDAGFGDADHVLVMLMEARGVLSAARDRGLITVTDVNIALSSERIVRDEIRRHPGWEPDCYFWGETFSEVDPTFRPSLETLEKTDVFLCPSDFVQSDLINNFGISAERTRLLPYAVNPRWLNLLPRPEPGRILFAGTAGLRKGIHILAEAALILQGRGRFYQFRIAGAASEIVRSRRETKSLHFLGRLNFEEMCAEFGSADVLAFPSLAEGSAGVTYEAMGCGVPVVTTRAAGSIIRDGVDGRIVLEGDPHSLADALEQIIEDRDLRMRMACAARTHAEEHSWEAFSERLTAAITPTRTTFGAELRA